MSAKRFADGQARELLRNYIATRNRADAEPLISSAMPLIRLLAGRFHRLVPKIALDDFIEEGKIGAITAADLAGPDFYDVGASTDPRMYAAPFIAGHLVSFLRDLGIITRPSETEDRVRHVVDAALADLAKELGRFPTDEELAASMSVSVERLRRLLLICCAHWNSSSYWRGHAEQESQRLRDARTVDPE
ncbi:MAG: sigma-70 domain-containing protein [Armatimonadota bacterium]|nr:sigma-70 domain-containing protein [Armatimonadota bacterium]